MRSRHATRSQGQPTTSQSRYQSNSQQAGPSQIKRKTRLQFEDEDEDGDEEEEEEDADGDIDGDMVEAEADPDADIRGSTTNELQRRASDLVRLALFTEYKRVPLKREEITKKVLGSKSRAFQHVFDRAQEILRKTFGMELTELPSRSELETDANPVMEDELDEAHKAVGVRKKSVVGSRTYILRSVLDPLLIEHASQTDEQIFEAETAEMPEHEADSDDDNDYALRSYGSIISWSECDNLGPLGILYTILALILVSGKAMNDMELRTRLKRLGLGPESRVSFPTSATCRSVPIEQYLSTLLRQGYLFRHEIGGGGIESTVGGRSKKKSGMKRTRVSLRDHGEDGETGSVANSEWRWGTRAMAEVGEVAVAKWIAEFMVTTTPGGEKLDDDEECEQRQTNGRKKGKKSGERRENVEQKLEKMLKGVQRAAGGDLEDVK